MNRILQNKTGASKTIAVLGHINPDGDCVGSTLALYNYLKDNMPEKEVTVWLEAPPAKNQACTEAEITETAAMIAYPRRNSEKIAMPKSTSSAQIRQEPWKNGIDTAIRPARITEPHGCSGSAFLPIHASREIKNIFAFFPAPFVRERCRNILRKCGRKRNISTSTSPTPSAR